MNTKKLKIRAWLGRKRSRPIYHRIIRTKEEFLSLFGDPHAAVTRISELTLVEALDRASPPVLMGVVRVKTNPVTDAYEALDMLSLMEESNGLFVCRVYTEPPPDSPPMNDDGTVPTT